MLIWRPTFGRNTLKWRQNLTFRLLLHLAILPFYELPIASTACDQSFEGFGIYLGSVDHFAISPSGTISEVFEKIYNDLGIRHFRTSYESTFSPRKDVYEIVCGSDARICSWIEVHKEISKYENTSFMASIWSPPRHMKNLILQTLPLKEEANFHYFITNVTELMKTNFNIQVERVSPINEPENLLASWEHANMSPQQLCRMVGDFNDPLISVCPENAHFTSSLSFAKGHTPQCLETCRVFGTHAYTVHIGLNNIFKAYYDLQPRPRTIPSNVSIWQTEVCSTFDNSENNQMRESLDMAINIANFVGFTCIQRYYFWYSYTLNPSGESLIWGNSNGTLTLPKKYFVYKHFTLAAHGGSKSVNAGSVDKVSYVTFGAKAVFINNFKAIAPWMGVLRCLANTFCCTTDLYDWSCSYDDNSISFPAESVCSCELDT